MDFKTLIRAMSTRPAELLGLPAGSLRAGSPADVIIIDADIPGCWIPPISNRNARTRRSTEARFQPRRAHIVGGGRLMSMSDARKYFAPEEQRCHLKHGCRWRSSWAICSARFRRAVLTKARRYP